MKYFVSASPFLFLFLVPFRLFAQPLSDSTQRGVPGRTNSEAQRQKPYVIFISADHGMTQVDTLHGISLPAAVDTTKFVLAPDETMLHLYAKDKKDIGPAYHSRHAWFRQCLPRYACNLLCVGPSIQTASDHTAF